MPVPRLQKPKKRTMTMDNKKQIITFAIAREMVASALRGTKYEDAPLEECGGGDGAEDIKPFRIDRRGDVDFGVTVYPEGDMLFWVWDDNGIQVELHTAEEAIAAFEE